MFKRLLLALALGATLYACTPAPGSNSGATVGPSVVAPSEAAPSDALPSDAMPTESATPSAS